MKQFLFDNELLIQQKTINRQVTLLIASMEGYTAIDPREVSYCCTKGKKTSRWFFKNGKEIEVKHNLRHSTKLLEEHNFFPISPSILVNLQEIFQIFTGTPSKIALVSGLQFDISERKRRKLLEVLRGLCL